MPVFKRRERTQRPWCYRFWQNGIQHKQCGFPTRKAAQEAEAGARLQLRRMTTGTVFFAALNRRLDLLKAYATANHCRDHRAMLIRFREWENLTLPEITPAMVRDKLMDLARDLGNSNANRHLQAIRAVFELAVNDGDLARNPCRGFKAFPVTRPVKFTPTEGQIAQVLLLAAPLDRAYLTLIWRTGARVREIHRLTWEDVAWERRQVCLRTRKKRDGHLTPRFVALDDRAYEALAYAHRRRDPNSPYVFTNPLTGKPWDYRDKFFDTLCRRAGLPEMGYHALRHALASELADQGRPLPAIRDLLGHENISTTSRYLKSLGREG